MIRKRKICWKVLKSCLQTFAKPWIKKKTMMMLFRFLTYCLVFVKKYRYREPHEQFF